MGNVGIIGRARVGKDTAGQWLVDNRGYRRVGFADPLKEAALKLDPIIQAEETRGDWGDCDLRISEAVKLFGWEAAKDTYPEVRRILQELGASIRAIDEDFWLRAAMAKVRAANEYGFPAVITDVRYPNEADSLRRAGFHLIHIERPSVPHLDHQSEGALTGHDADFSIRNASDVDTFLGKVELVVERIYTIESRQHYARSL
ncbi:hypothetical protein [Streptomyces sp. NPDC088554]|uniref:deoxynucleotide monophosphate kinase family protein n=1 Tax=Streptomyces sp. NPDC088554 TaxID=3365865 RepID=UPI003801C7CD